MYVRRRPELWLWMHRRWRENGSPAEGVAGGRSMFPAGKAEGPADDVNDVDRSDDL